MIRCVDVTVGAFLYLLEWQNAINYAFYFLIFVKNADFFNSQ